MTSFYANAINLPAFVVLKSVEYGKYLHYKEDGTVGFEETSEYSPAAKIAVERSKSDSKLMSFRFSISNMYMRYDASSKRLVADCKQPEEDKSKPSYTLFLVFPDSRHPGKNQVNLRNVDFNMGFDLIYMDWNAMANMPSIYLPTFVVLKSTEYGKYLHYKEDGTVGYEEASIHSPAAKIAAERGKTYPRYTSFRFCISNRYLRFDQSSKRLVAESKQPDEDLSKPSCTLFRVVAGTSENVVALRGVNFIMSFEFNKDLCMFTYVDWQTLVQLPQRVAFREPNQKYIQAFTSKDGVPMLKFNGDDPHDPLAAHTVTMLDDGRIIIKSDHFDRYWRLDEFKNIDFMIVDSGSTGTSVNISTGKYPDIVVVDGIYFWPVRLDSNTIALKNLKNNKFCKRLTDHGHESCLSASVPAITGYTKLTVKDLVSSRKYYNVRYRMEDARIHDETPFVAGTANAMNFSDHEGDISVKIAYTDESTQTFSNSLSIAAGVSASMSAGIPLIGETEITVSLEVTTAFEWGQSTTKSVQTEATASIPVPPKSVSNVSFVGTRGVCDVPFSYTQQDTSSIDGTIHVNEKIDGMFTGVNCYRYSFVINETHPLSSVDLDKTKPTIIR